MPALSEKTKHYYRERIRSILVQAPQVSNEGIRQRLQRDGLTLDRHYIGKLVNEIHVERMRAGCEQLLGQIFNLDLPKIHWIEA